MEIMGLLRQENRTLEYWNVHSSISSATQLVVVLGLMKFRKDEPETPII